MERKALRIERGRPFEKIHGQFNIKFIETLPITEGFGVSNRQKEILGSMEVYIEGDKIVQGGIYR